MNNKGLLIILISFVIVLFSICDQTWALPIGQIVFERDGDIWLMNDDGTNQTNLTNSSNIETNPSFSTDGRRIAYSDDTAKQLLIMNIDGSGITSIFESQSSVITFCPTWSPDDTRILFRDGPYNSYDLWTIGIDGTGIMRVTTDGNNFGGPALSPDGSTIATVRRDMINNSNSEYLWFLNADGTNYTKIGYGAYPNWSPDGSRIADGNGDIFTMTSDGSNPIYLTSDPAWEWDPSWSPYGDQLVFTKGYDLWKMDADGSNQVQLTFTGGIHADWGPASPVPEPTTILLLASGLVGLAGFRGRFRKN